MSGRTVDYVNASRGRDAGKMFRIEEKSARDAEWWALRMIIAVKGTTAQVPEAMASMGYGAIAIRGLNSFLAADVDPNKLRPLLNEMLECVTIVRDRAVNDPVKGGPMGTPLMDDDIEEISTIEWLRGEVLRVHTGFSVVEFFLTWWGTLSQPPSMPTTTLPPSS